LEKEKSAARTGGCENHKGVAAQYLQIERSAEITGQSDFYETRIIELPYAG
jgi:hypothetical protein